MKKFFTLILIVVAFAACKTTPKFRTYQDAENEFRASLTAQDTITVLTLGSNFMDAMRAGIVEDQLRYLCVVHDNVLYKAADESIEELRQRYAAPISDFALAGYNFSTPGINDLSYCYTYSGKVGSGPAFKIVFNPVKVGDTWYLTLKDGNMSSTDKAEADQIHPLSAAPAEIKLNTPDLY